MGLRYFRWSRTALDHPREAKAVPIVGDGAIATGAVGDGRLIPLLILDTSDRPDIEEFIRAHEHFPDGDVETFWCRLARDEDNKISLCLRFLRPIQCTCIVTFDIIKHGVLVEQILSTRAVYLMAGKQGDRISHNPSARKALAEIPDTDFRRHWDKMFRKNMVRRFKKEGCDRHQARRAASKYIESIRSLSEFRKSQI